jgi:hypothetical protein
MFLGLTSIVRYLSIRHEGINAKAFITVRALDEIRAWQEYITKEYILVLGA